MDEKSKKTVTMEQVLESARQAEALAIQVAEAVQAELETKQDKLTGTPGQVVGFDAKGKAVPVALPEGQPTDGQYLPTDGSVAMEGDLDMGTHRIKFGDVFIASADDGSMDGSGEGEEGPSVEDEPGGEEPVEGETGGEELVEGETGGEEPVEGELNEEEEEVDGGGPGGEGEENVGGELVEGETGEGETGGGETVEGETSGLKLMYGDGTLACLAVADPQGAKDAATKGYVDGLLNTLKESIATLLDEINGEAA